MKIASSLTLASVLLVTMAVAPAGEGTRSLDQLPAAAQATIKAETAHATIKSIQREGHDQFEVETLLNGKSHDLVVDEKGRLVSIEDETDLAQVPAKAQATIRKQAGTVAVVRVEKVTEGKDVSYEAELAPDSHGKKFEIVVREDGSLRSRKEDDEDKD